MLTCIQDSGQSILTIWLQPYLRRAVRTSGEMMRGEIKRGEINRNGPPNPFTHSQTLKRSGGSPKGKYGRSVKRRRISNFSFIGPTIRRIEDTRAAMVRISSQFRGTPSYDTLAVAIRIVGVWAQFRRLRYVSFEPRSGKCARIQILGVRGALSYYAKMISPFIDTHSYATREFIVLFVGGRDPFLA